MYITVRTTHLHGTRAPYVSSLRCFWWYVVFASVCSSSPIGYVDLSIQSLCVILFTGLLCVSQAHGQDEKQQKIQKKRRMQYFMEHGHFPEEASINYPRDTREYSGRRRRPPRTNWVLCTTSYSMYRHVLIYRYNILQDALPYSSVHKRCKCTMQLAT